MNFRKSFAGWGVILLLALFLRLVGLDLNPVGLSHDDELHDLINAKSLAVTGENTPGVVAGILTPNGRCLGADCIYGELESYAQIPWMRIFPLDIVLSKIPFVLASVILVWAAGKFFENLSGNMTIGKITGLLLAINPWAIYYGRTAYSYTFTFLLFILAVYFFTRSKSFKSNLIFGAISSFLASLFYFGAKPIMPLVILWGVIYNFYIFKFRYFKFALVFIFIAGIIIGSYFLILSNSLAGKRFLEIGATSITISERVGAYLNFFSPVSMFLTGQNATDNYYLSGMGYFYLIELPFLILGIIAIFKKKIKAGFLLGLIAIAVLPAAIKTTPASIYSLRTGLAYPLIMGVIAWGYYDGAGLVSLVEKKYGLERKIHLSKIFVLGIFSLYIVSIVYFMFLYWHRLPIQQASRWFFHERVVADYITRLKNNSNQKVVVLSGRTDGIYNSYVFYSGIYDSSEAIREINKSYLSEAPEYNGVKFVNDCRQITAEDVSSSVIFVDQINQVNCGLYQKNTPKIANPKDAGGMFNILNESLCAKYPKERFPRIKNIYDFKVENLSNQDFCRIWITNPGDY